MVSTIAVVNQPISHRPLPKSQTMAPLVQPPSPRVHFPSTTSLTTSSRPPTTTENWTLYNFEIHSRTCPSCQHPYKRWQSKLSLCPTGASLAYQASGICYLLDSQTYERQSKPGNPPVRLEVPHTYTFLRQHLRVMEEMAKMLPKVEGDRKVKVKVHDKEVRGERKLRRTDSMEVIIETARTDKREKERRDNYRSEDREREVREHRRRGKEYKTEDKNERRGKEYKREEKSERREKEYRHEEKRENEYRHEEKRERRYRKDEQGDVVVGEKRYRTQDRRPAWVEEGKGY